MSKKSNTKRLKKVYEDIINERVKVSPFLADLQKKLEEFVKEQVDVIDEGLEDDEMPKESKEFLLERKRKLKETEKNLDLVVELEFLKQKTKEDTSGRGVFVVPWMNYCGEKTKIVENVINNVPPVDRVDAVCRQHDIDYGQAQTPEEVRKADERMLKSLSEIKNPTASERFNRKLGEYAIKSKIRLEDMGVLSAGSFSGINELKKKEIERITSMMNKQVETALATGEIIEEDMKGVFEANRILEGLKRGTSFKEFKAEVAFLNIDDNILKDIYINQQKMPISKKERKELKAKVEALLERKANVEEYDDKMFDVMSKSQLRELIIEHNTQRMVRQKLGRKLKIPKTGNLTILRKNLRKTKQDLVDGIQPDEKADDADRFLQLLSKRDAGTLAGGQTQRLVELRKKLGPKRVKELEKQYEQDKRTTERVKELSKLTPKVVKERPTSEEMRKRLSERMTQFQQQQFTRITGIWLDLGSNEIIKELRRKGKIREEDIELFRNKIEDIQNVLSKEGVVFEDEDKQRMVKLIDNLEDSIKSLTPTTRRKEFLVIDKRIEKDLDDILNQIIEEKQEEEREEREEEEDIKKSFEEKRIKPQFKIPEGEEEARKQQEQADIEMKKREVPDDLKTSTDRNNNTLPRDRRPFFFTLGTDLITKTPEEQEEDIETFADFSWIPKDGNFYNGKDNVIVSANRANDIIRYDMNNQFGGLWMPQAPQPVFKLKPESDLYQKMRVSVAPITQNIQQRVPINSRADPGPVKLYTEYVTGLSDMFRRNNIKNRIIFPDVVDGMRV
jgi:hypothetical protein